VPNKKKLLFVSNTAPDRIIHILDAFKNRDDLEIEVEHLWLEKRKNGFMTKVFDKLKIPIDPDRLNQRILSKVKSFKPDIVFIVKGNNIYPTILKKIKENKDIKLISWSLDDMYAKHNRSYYYTKGLKYYDVVFTSKSYNLKELKELGAKKVEFLYQAFSEKYHKPCNDCSKVSYKTDVLFIGFAEKDRFKDLNYLAQNGIKIDIFGSGWNKKQFQNHHENLNITPKDLLGNDYANAISCSKISLCFLRKANRDLHTSRSIEIPACGGFMIAERTAEHKLLFEEDKEAIYFDNKKELLTKVKYYLENEEERNSIRNAGYKRTRKDDYSYDDMVNRILNAI
jgi:spore maturation protein CgeB